MIFLRLKLIAVIKSKDIEILEGEAITANYLVNIIKRTFLAFFQLHSMSREQWIFIPNFL